MSIPERFSPDDLERVIDELREIEFYLQLEGANQWKRRSYLTAADALDGEDPEILQKALSKDIDGIGESIAADIRDILVNGESDKLVGLKEEHADLSELIEVEGLGPKTAKKLYEELGVETLEDLEDACKAHNVSVLDGLGTKTEEKFLEEIKNVRAGVNERKEYEDVVPYWDGLESRLNVLKRKGHLERFEPAGSFRRQAETIGDLDVIIEADDAGPIFDSIENSRITDNVLMRGDTKMSFRIDNLQIDIRVVDRDEYGACLQYFTGDLEHNVELRSYALEKGYTINEYGIFEIDGRDKKGDIIKGKKVGGEDESDIYNVLGMPLPDPTDRTEQWVKDQIDLKS